MVGFRRGAVFGAFVGALTAHNAFDRPGLIGVFGIATGIVGLLSYLVYGWVKKN